MQDFWTLFAAVLGGNILTVCFVWACINISRREERKEGAGIYVVGFLMPLLFLLAGLYTVL